MTNAMVARTRARVTRRDSVVAVAAAGAAALGWLVWTQVGSVDLVVGSGGGARHVGLVAVAVSALVAAAAGALLRRLLHRPAWTAAAVAVALLSMVGPAGAATLAAGVGLASLHLVVAAVVVVGLRGSTS